MEIEFLKQLNDNTSIRVNNSDYTSVLVPLSIEQIDSLETNFNHGNQFPKALKELLYLAGGNCYVLDYGLNDTQEEMQEDARSWMEDFNRSINRPFFVIDVYNAGDQFLFVYLDEGIDDPEVYGAFLPSLRYEATSWINGTNKKLSEFIDHRVKKVLSGYSPF